VFLCSLTVLAVAVQRRKALRSASMKNKLSTGGLVYSTDAGRMCPACRQPVAQCVCGQRSVVPAGDGVVRVSRETKGRGGKAVTLVKGVSLDAAGLAALGKQLKAACGTGGTVKDGVIEIQGDHVERIMATLKAQGLVVKRAGG
jgi:translation initiation factor 1